MNFNHSFVPLKLAEAQSFVAEHHRHSKPNKIRIFTIPRLTDDDEKCFSAEIYSDHPTDTFNYAIA